MRVFQTSQGTLTLGEKTVPLKFAYAFELANDTTLPPKTELHLLLSDQPVPESALFGVFGRYPLQQDGKLVGVEFDLSEKDLTKTLHGQLLAAPPEGISSFTVTGKKYFSALTITTTAVEGSVASEPSTAPSPNGEPIPYRYEASFRAPLRKAPPVTKILKGKAAQSHPFVAVIARYFAAARKADYAAMQKLVSKATLASWERIEQKMGASEYRKQLSAFGKEMEFNPKAITHIVFRGSLVTVVTHEKGWRSGSILVQEDGVWKMDLP